MSHTSLFHSAITGRLAETVREELVLALITIGLVTGISVARLDGPWLYAIPAIAVAYSAIRIGLVVRRNRGRDGD